MTHTPSEIERALAEPFDPEDVQWKPVAFPQGTRERALVVPFYDVTLVYRRLDEVVGAFNWQIRHTSLGNAVVTEIGILAPTHGSDAPYHEWIWKGDIGMTDRDTDRTTGEVVESSTKVKGDASDGAKRAGALWGIGRCYREIDKSTNWVDWDDQKKEPKSKPHLPPFALPYNMRPGAKAAAPKDTEPKGAEPAAPALGPARPYPPEKVREGLIYLANKFKSDPELKPATKAQRGLAVGMIESLFPEAGDTFRKSILLYWFGKESSAALSNEEVHAILKFLAIEKRDGKTVPGEYAAKELLETAAMLLEAAAASKKG